MYRAFPVLILLALSLAGCSLAGSPPPPEGPEAAVENQEVSFILESGSTVYGTRYGSGETALILVHMFTYNASQKDWSRFARTAADAGYAVLTIDVPGFGKSPGDPGEPRWEEAVQGAALYLESQGFTRIACGGACTGGNACLSLAAKYPLAGLALIAAEHPGEDFDFQSLGMPTFYAASEEDGGGDFARAAEVMHRHSPGPSQLLIFPGSVHGTDLFNSYYGSELTEALLAFLDSLP